MWEYKGKDPEADAEIHRLREAIIAWGREDSLPDCPACAVFDAELRGE